MDAKLAAKRNPARGDVAVGYEAISNSRPCEWGMMLGPGGKFVDHEVLAMNHKQTFSTALGAVVVAATLAMAMATSALGACKTTLRGELVQAPNTSQAVPQKLLFFSFDETAQDNRPGVEKRFQSFTVPNTSTTLPIPFVLHIDSPKDCPSELELNVSSGDSDLPVFRFASWQPPLRGRKTIRLDNFETIPVWGSRF